MATGGTVVSQSLGTLNDLGQWVIFKSARKSMTWDMGHSAGREPGPLLRAKRGFLKSRGTGGTEDVSPKVSTLD